MNSSSQKPLALVAAVSLNNVIGKDGGLPWRVPEDLKHFKRVTRGHTVIMGRRTYTDELKKPLPQRRNLVVSRQVNLELPGVEVFQTVEAAIEAARTTDPEPRIIGGAGVYAAALPYVTRMYLTRIKLTVEGDTHFPPFDPEDWEETERRETEAAIYMILDRRDQGAQ